MSKFTTLVLMAIIVEGLITYAKTFFVNGKPQWQMLVGIVLGVVVALAYNVDAFAALGITSVVPFVGAILTGVLISRGSNYIFDLVKALQSVGSGSLNTIEQAVAPLIGSIKEVADNVKSAENISVYTNSATNTPSVSLQQEVTETDSKATSSDDAESVSQ